MGEVQRAFSFLSGSPAMNVYTFKRTGTLIEKEKKKNIRYWWVWIRY
jgi:hypothetical protein